MTARTQQIRETIAKITTLDTEWMNPSVGHDDPGQYIPWLPFPWHDFVSLVAEALPDMPGNHFFEIGAGIGTKMMLAKEIFGFDVTGIERVPEYAARARKLGLTVINADALAWNGYGGYGMVWFNRPFADPLTQAKLEAKVWDEVSPGTVVIGVNLEAPPPVSWYPILDDREVRRWISQKPLA